jgi:hypothetical protein
VCGDTRPGLECHHSGLTALIAEAHERREPLSRQAEPAADERRVRVAFVSWAGDTRGPWAYSAVVTTIRSSSPHMRRPRERVPKGGSSPKRIVSDSFSAVPRRRSQLDVWAAAGEGPSGELELAVACDKAAISRIKC